MNKNLNLSICEDVCCQECEEGLMVYVQSNGMVHMVNNVAGYVIKMCENQVQQQEKIIESICSDFVDVDKEMVTTDVNDIVDKFIQMGVLQVV